MNNEVARYDGFAACDSSETAQLTAGLQFFDFSDDVVQVMEIQSVGSGGVSARPVECGDCPPMEVFTSGDIVVHKAFRLDTMRFRVSECDGEVSTVEMLDIAMPNGSRVAKFRSRELTKMV